jgi:hypothetical protein
MEVEQSEILCSGKSTPIIGVGFGLGLRSILLKRVSLVKKESIMILNENSRPSIQTRKGRFE